MDVLPAPARSKYLPPSFFNRNRRNFTRYQANRIRAVFDFLGLPAELRNVIYELCIDFDGIEKYFDNAYRMLGRAQNTDTADYHRPRVVRKNTPKIFLICRQIYVEAFAVLGKKSVNFHHGLVRLSCVNDVMSESLINRLGSITISAKGHPLLQENIFRTSFRGYMELIRDLADLLSNGHRLKEFTIDLSDDELAKHITYCWNDPIDCPFRDYIKVAFGDLKEFVRDVPCVKIKGIDDEFARDVKTYMQSKRVSFLTLPGEIRNRIYEYAVEYSDISRKIAHIMKDWDEHKHQVSIPYPPTTTPTVLLLNRQIYREAYSLLKKKPLTIICPKVVGIQKQDEVPNLIYFVSAGTLQSVRHLSIRVESWEWVFAVERLLALLAQNHRLKSFHLVFNDHLKDSFYGVQDKLYPDKTIATGLCDLEEIRGIGKVLFEGDLPDVYTKPLMMSMRAKKGSTALGLQEPKALRWDGAVVDLEYEGGP